jgi:hypothetical protein
VINLILLARNHVQDSQPGNASNATHKWQKFELEVDRLLALDFARNLRVAATDHDLFWVISVIVDRQLESHVVVCQIVQSELDPLRSLKDKSLWRL